MANMTALSINESLFYIPFDHTGVISVCNNKYGNELACIVSDISDDRTSLNIGDSVCIKRIVSEVLSRYMSLLCLISLTRKRSL